MPLPICYLNGNYLPLQEARISPLDRGFLFADSVYEVVPVFGGKPFREAGHFDRLARSLSEIRLASPHTHEQWHAILEELVRRNGGGNLYVYLQVTRGTELGRSHAFPPPRIAPTVFALASELPAPAAQPATGLSAITVEDFRWSRCDIKATTLLPNVLMKQQAADAGAQEAIIVSQGEVLEGTSTSIFVVRNAVLATVPNGPRILPGITREVVLELAAGLMPVEIRRIGVDELRTADEVWLTSSTRDVLPITCIDHQPVGDGRAGPFWQRMSAAFNALRSA